MATNPVSLPTINMGTRKPSRNPFFEPTVISTGEYFSGPVDFYSQTLGTGIQSTVGDEDESEEDQTEDTSPNLFEPIGGDGGDQYQSALQHTLGSGLQPTYDVTSYGVNDLKVDQMSFSPDLTKSAFEDIVTNTFTGLKNTTGFGKFTETPMAMGPLGKPRAVGLPGAVSAGLALTPAAPFAPMAAFFGAMSMAQQARTAAEIKASGGIAGSFMDVNGMMVSRSPGSLTYNGNLQGLSSEQMASLDAVKRGFVPGTLKAEVFDKKTNSWLQATGVKSMMSSDDMMSVGGTYDPTTGKFVDSLGQTSAMGTKKAAQTLANTFNNKLGSTMSWQDANAIRSTIETDIFGNVKSGSKTFEQAYKDAAIASASANTGLSASQLENVYDGSDFVVSGRGRGVNSKGYSTFSDFRGSSEEEDDAPDTGSSTPSANATYDASAISGTPSAPDEDPFVGYEYGDNNNDGGGQSDGSAASSDSSGQGQDSSAADVGDDAAMGGRIGYAPGGEAGFAQRPEFVGGNQTQPDGVSVADDQPRDVQEGTFVINAAAADFAGRGDIEKMLRDAYKKVGDTGQSGVTQEVAINVSKGEVMIPPHIAKEIGYDKLNKINNRGKKEIARRQKTAQAASGGFISK